MPTVYTAKDIILRKMIQANYTQAEIDAYFNTEGKVGDILGLLTFTETEGSIPAVEWLTHILNNEKEKTA